MDARGIFCFARRQTKGAVYVLKKQSHSTGLFINYVKQLRGRGEGCSPNCVTKIINRP